MATTKIKLGTFKTGTKVLKNSVELSTLNVETKYLHNVIFRTKSGERHTLNIVDTCKFNLSFSLVSDSLTFDFMDLWGIIMTSPIDCVGHIYIYNTYEKSYIKGFVTKICVRPDEDNEDYFLNFIYIADNFVENETYSDAESDGSGKIEIIDTVTPILVEVE